jgi:cyclopropane fatty-acyl-phospholipid synthase-like methyltransferase
MEYCDYNEWAKIVDENVLEFKIEGRDLLDLGCGTGEILLYLQQKYQCTGIDISEEMLKVAQKKLKGNNIPLYCGDMRNFDTGKKYDVIISFFDTITHLTSIEELKENFKSVANALKERGLYIFDVVDRKFMEEMFPGDVFVDQRKNITTIWEHDFDEGIDYIDATYFVKNKNGYFEKIQESYEKKLFTFLEIEEAAKENGLKITKKYLNDKIAGEREFFVLRLDGQ